MDYRGIKALIMGLGLHGGGLESARFLLKRGAQLTVTDLRDEKTLAPTIEKLGKDNVRYVLGKHEIDDFKNADIVIKNPGVRADSPFLLAAKKIETDISLFLSESKARLFAVTGSKGKSTVSTALAWILEHGITKGKTYLGGNITVSPLTFLDELTENDNVVLELSSFQLGDLKGNPLLKPAACILTAIMSDHQDRYVSMDDYIDDKRNIYRGQDASCVTIAGDDEWGKSFLSQTKGRPLVYSRFALSEGVSGGWLQDGCAVGRLLGFEGVSGAAEELVPSSLLTPGDHQKINMLSAALAAYSFGVSADKIRGALSCFKGVEHRLEFFHEAKGVRYYNDSASTIPEAASVCIEALCCQASLVLVTGGTDKNLDFTALAKKCGKPKAIILIAGSGTKKLSVLLDEEGIKYCGPFDNLDDAVRAAIEKTEKGDTVALSPGCASFEMFLNEFDRGRKWKEAVLRLT